LSLRFEEKDMNMRSTDMNDITYLPQARQ
jgi:hypothetical protein